MTTFTPGTRVAYRTHQTAAPEYGEVKRVGDFHVFVLFDGDMRTKACSPDVLERA